MADAFATVDDYIGSFPADVRAIIERIRSIILAVEPEADEVISYGMPALRQHGVLVYFAAFKAHVGFYPPVRGDARLVEAASRYAGKKGNLRFPLDEPMPLELIRDLTRQRVLEDRAAAARA